MEAYALLVGAIASFAAIAAAMYITRNVDWYGSGASPSGSPSIVSAPGTHQSWLD